jgi:RecJ-like exonuclease
VDKERCPVCEGEGGWSKRTFKPERRAPGDNSDSEWSRCLFCNGERFVKVRNA